MHTRIQLSEVFLWQQGPVFPPNTGHHTTRFDLMHPRPPEEGKGCAQLLIIIIITTTTIIINKRRKKKDKTGRNERLSSAASCGGFSGRDREYISIYRQGRKAGDGGVTPFTPCPPPLLRPSQRTGSSVCNSLSDQVPVEIIRDFLIGAWRRP